MPDDLYPAVGFHFAVRFSPGSKDVDASFREAGGIDSQLKTTAYREGGENRFVHALPNAVEHPLLSLRRGIASKDSPLVKWCKETLEGGLVERIETKSMSVLLLDAEGHALRVWSFANAYPVRWTVDAFDATRNEVAMERIELSYAYCRREL